MVGLPARRNGRLFIIGAARSGTTVLQNALNHSPQIFLFGEPDLCGEDGQAGFAGRYNAMHRSWSNQETKSTFCPPILDEDGCWRDYWDRLSKTHRWVGAKIVVNAMGGPDWIDRLFTFHCRHFYDAHYIFTFRNPLAVVSSTHELQLMTGGGLSGLPAIMANYAETAALYLRALRNLPNVTAILHEDVGQATMRRLGRWLDVPLTGTERYFDDRRVRRYDASSFDEEDQRHIQRLDTLYETLRLAAAESSAPLQLEQNDAHPLEDHFIPIGSAARQAAMLSDYFRNLSRQPALRSTG